jgi:hypothetical protein
MDVKQMASQATPFIEILDRIVTFTTGGAALGSFVKKVLSPKKVEEKVVTNGTTASEAGPEVKGGGIFNLSDEVAYQGIQAKFEGSHTGRKIDAFIKNHLTEEQARRFRSTFGQLASVDYEQVKVLERETIPQSPGKGGIKLNDIVKEKVLTTKINLAVSFLEKFADYSDEEKMAFCDASGILRSEMDFAKDTLSSARLDTAEGINRLADALRPKSKPKDEQSLGRKIASFFGF